MAKIFVKGESTIMESLFRRQSDPQSAFIKLLLCARRVDILHNISVLRRTALSRKLFPPILYLRTQGLKDI